VVFPLGMKFLLAVGMKMDISATLSVSWYLTFVLKLMIAFGSVFELPVVVFFLAKIGIVNADMLRRYRRFAIVGIFIIAAILTPPDLISQIAMAIPLLLLYEVSIYIAKTVAPKKPAEEAVEADIYQ
jgi:sec-independent protein translocase protein TatC